jgi:titin
VIAASPTAIKISWNDGSDNETGFEINNGEISAMVGPDVTSYTWTGLSPGSYMCVHVRAVKGARSSVWEPADAPYYQCTTTPASPAN